MMNWQEILIILVPLLGLMAWVYNRLDKRFDAILNEMKDMRKDIQDLRKDIQDLRKDIQSLDSRISRIEGQLTGIYHWEPRILEKKEDNK